MATGVEYQARELLDPRIPKSEREHAAALTEESLDTPGSKNTSSIRTGQN